MSSRTPESTAPHAVGEEYKPARYVQREALARHEGIGVVHAVAHGQHTHVRVGVDHHHKRAPPRLILAPVRSSDGVPAATGAVLALMAAGAMREHYAGATASAIAEPLRRSSSWTTVIVRKPEGGAACW